jgi:protein-L-isoaspartate(D-aspartate) O-methyltransferase
MARWVTRRSMPLALLWLAAVAPLGAEAAENAAAYAARRAEMVRVIEFHARDSAWALGRDGLSDKVLAVMGQVPRHRFVPDELRDLAYADRPLPIGHGQTISQPFIVALMTDLLDPALGDRVLEVGTGSGYQAAVLAPLVERVCTIEIIPALGATAAERLGRPETANVRTRVGDGYYGWPDCGPFDGIVVTAAASHVPPPLIEQLKPGGRMVIPVGGPFAVQQLLLVYKTTDGAVGTRQLLPVRFVPFTRDAE